MTKPNEPRALADLARALEAAGWTINDTPRELQIRKQTNWIIYESGNFFFDGEMTDDTWSALTLCRAWQAPPSPDAGAAFSAAVDEVIEDAAYVEEVKYQGDVKQEEAARFLANSKAALLAFAPGVTPTITTERLAAMESVVNAAKKLERALEPPECYDMQNMADAQGEILQALYDLNGGAHE